MVMSPVSAHITESCVFSTFPLKITSLSALMPLVILMLPVRPISPAASIGILTLMFVSSRK